MPLPREVLERLLGLFPVTALREFGQPDEPMTKEDLISAIADGKSENAVLNFVASNAGVLHQHVYVFDKRPADGNNGFDPAAPFGAAPYRQYNVGNERVYHYLLELTYEVLLDDPLERAELGFAWPVKMVVAPRHIRVHFTIMAKSLAAYSPGGRPVLRSSPSLDEEDLLDGFPATLGMPPRGALDLNQGVKALWEAGEFDSPVVRYVEDKATTRAVMHEDQLVKRDDPERYAEMLLTPLLDTTLLFMGENPCVKHVVVNACEGTLAFRVYSSSNDCIDDVIRRILQAN